MKLLIQPNVPPDIPQNLDRAVVPPPAGQCTFALHFEPEVSFSRESLHKEDPIQVLH
jgi:hypothetical protein